MFVNALFDQFVPMAEPPNQPHSSINSQMFEFLDIEAKNRFQMDTIEKSPINNDDATFCELMESRAGTLIFVGMHQRVEISLSLSLSLSLSERCCAYDSRIVLYSIAFYNMLHPLPDIRARAFATMARLIPARFGVRREEFDDSSVQLLRAAVKKYQACAVGEYDQHAH
jgi:hypothetical protein